MENLPQEILTEILINLPVKTLVRLTVVSKSWQSLITSPSFISTHLTKIQNQTTKNCDGLLLCRHYSQNDKKEHYTLHPDNDDFVLNSSEINFPFKSGLGFYRIIGSCNGLVCLCDAMLGGFRKKPIFLWNPSVRRSIELPLPRIQPEWSPLKRFFIGFGYDSQRFDYKVVRIVYDQRKVPILDHLPPKAEAEVYSLSTKDWRVVPRGPEYYIAEFSHSQVFVNGIVHWLACDEKRNSRNLIMGFDMKDEIFTEIVLPEVLAGEDAANLYAIKHGGCLAVMKDNAFRGYWSLWVMMEYGSVESWIRVYDVNLQAYMGRVIGFRRNGHFLATMLDVPVNDRCSGVLVSCDPESGVIKDLEIFGKMKSMYVENFVESLVLLEGQSGLQSDACPFSDKNH